MVTVGELVAAGATLRCGEPSARFARVVVDGREARPGDLFVALPGERTDGHRYWRQAVAGGATGLLVSEWPLPDAGAADPPESVTVLWAEAPPEVLWRAAEARLGGLRRRLVAVTGSVGKTTTKEFAADLLARRWRTFRSGGNRNTEVGLPLSLLELTGAEEAGVVEFGMRGPGQIRALAERVRPRIGVVTAIGESHIGVLGSLEAIAAAKGELLEALPQDGVAIVPAADRFTEALAGRARCPVWRVGLDPGADLAALDVSPLPGGGSAFTLAFAGRKVPARLPLSGRHLVADAAFACAAAVAAGLPLEEAAAGVAQLRAAAGRSEVRQRGGVWILDDAYNASPQSVEAALETLVTLAPAGRRLALMGEMRELGAFSPPLHDRVGEMLGRAGLRAMVAVGDADADRLCAAACRVGMRPQAVVRVAEATQAVAALWRLGPPQAGEAVLVKGARAVGMDRAVADLDRLLGGGS